MEKSRNTNYNKKFVDKVKTAVAILIGALAINVATQQNANAQISTDVKKDTTQQNQQSRAYTETNTDDDLGLGNIDLGYDEENAELDKKNAELDKMLADAKARTQKVFENKEKANNELLNVLKDLVSASGNPADFDWYEDWAKKNNIKPEDLVD